MKVLVAGGSGYLGQYLVEALSREHQVGFTYNTGGKVVESMGGSKYKVDFCTGEGLEDMVSDFGEPQVVVNCAAISQPMVCEEERERSRSVNVPTTLVNDCLLSRCEGRPFLIHLSTDHVYDGSRSFYTEADEPGPVNAYGETKKEAEDFIVSRYPNHAIFRSSIIYGRGKEVGRNLFLQWMDEALGAGEKVDFFGNEFRSPVYVMDIVKLVRIIIARIENGVTAPARVANIYNLGGPERLSRADMAKALCTHRGYGIDSVLEADRPSHVKSPLDASMDVHLLRQTFGLHPTSFKDALSEIF
ncbi:RmlD substrate binding domain-containing protein [Chloropicon primus]|nr:RmlD substrate binding domain-containing protein [Chloropicon primus]|mmetsp:Transcript_5092/g.15292  ORF Transcript_5092/g.15292 Transcript_5092/m.15292 type:complete len:302 (+) Transcript_5092:128-1033(+)